MTRNCEELSIKDVVERSSTLDDRARPGLVQLIVEQSDGQNDQRLPHQRPNRFRSFRGRVTPRLVLKFVRLTRTRQPPSPVRRVRAAIVRNRWTTHVALLAGALL